MKSKIVLIAWLCVAASFASTAVGAAPRKYAMLSLIGDSLTVVTYRQQTGNFASSNLGKAVPLPEGALDQTALLAMDGAVRKIDPGSTSMLLGSSHGLSEMQDRMLSGQDFAAPNALADALEKEGATHLLLLTKYRGEASIQFTQTTTGSGMLQGLGFYVDREFFVRREDTEQVSVGFIAPYTYFRISLVDLATSKVLKQQTVTAAYPLLSDKAIQGSDAWDSVPVDEKINALQSMLETQVSKAVALVLQP